ncbi:MAG TPA: hypothetical protein VGK42_10110 [Candidatus Dormibacteraeota bacterium]|jgi:hypothetical protein
MSEARLCGQPRLSDGAPCGQRIGDGRQCIWHGEHATPEARSAIARLGGLRTLRTLPEDSPVPSFNSREEIVDYAEEQAQLVGIGKLDPRLSAEMRGWADLAMKAHELSALDRLAKLEKVVKGKRIA